MSKILQRPKISLPANSPSRFQRFYLSENPFPSEPVVNKDSNDKRINGNIYELEIRRKEYEQIENEFIKQPLSNPNHLRLGYIIDSSYIGRGNGKSAFLVNLLIDLNKEYCLDITEGSNKCFGVYVTPEPGGRTKTFPSFVDLIFQSIIRSKIISYCLATLRLEAILEINPGFEIGLMEDETLINNLNSIKWFQENKIDSIKVAELIQQKDLITTLPEDFPIFLDRNLFIHSLVNEENFIAYYDQLKKGKDRLEFVFTHLVKLFIASNFNGAFILVDDFERIPDFQSARQKRDFALELRSCLFDGLYTNAKYAFYNFLIVLHAGVPRLLSDAWAESGMENRAPISSRLASKHIVPFNKLNKEHAKLLMLKYLHEYRTDSSHSNSIYPFTEEAIARIGELSEYNAAKILKFAYDLLDKASQLEGVMTIDENFINANKDLYNELSDKESLSFKGSDTTNLLEKAQGDI